jgi:hypothetical protein
MMASSHCQYATPLAEDPEDLSSYTRECSQRLQTAPSLGRLDPAASDTSLRNNNSTLHLGRRAW